MFLSFFSSSPPPFFWGGGGGLGHLSCQMPLPLGRKKRVSAPPSIKIEEIFTDRTDEKCHLLRHFNVQFVVSVYIYLCNSAIIAKTSRPDDTIHESYVIICFLLVLLVLLVQCRIQKRGWGGGGAVSKKILTTLRALFWSKNKGKRPHPPPRPLPLDSPLYFVGK